MNLRELFEKTIQLLDAGGLRYALAGGLAASIYRKQERLTNDLDFLIFAESDPQGEAARVIRSLGMRPHTIRKADLEGGPLFAVKRQNTLPYMVIGRKDGDASAVGLDFILPAMPWFASALERAGKNQIDFGFGGVPCLTVEDLIIAKFFSFQNDQTRFNDLDDLKSVFLADHPLDLAYLSGQMKKIGLRVPKPLKTMVPNPLLIISKKIKAAR